MSGEHAAIVTILADSFLEDLGSTNGTLVNGTSVAKHFLRDRDEIDIGQEILVYLVDEAATLEALPAVGPAGPGAPGKGRMPPRRLRSAGARVVTGASRAKRRSDAAAPETAAAAPDSLERSFVADFERGIAETFAAAPDAVAAAAPLPPPERQSEPVPALRVVNGAKAGRIVALVKDETLIGRTGVQVAALRRTAEEVRVVPVEGAQSALREWSAGCAGGAGAHGGRHSGDCGDEARGRRPRDEVLRPDVLLDGHGGGAYDVVLAGQRSGSPGDVGPMAAMASTG